VSLELDDPGRARALFGFETNAPVRSGKAALRHGRLARQSIHEASADQGEPINTRHRSAEEVILFLLVQASRSGDARCEKLLM
jgi:hypothetical protein